MPIFDAKDLDADPEGEAMLARLLHPSPQARACAQSRGRDRVKRGTLILDAMSRRSGPCARPDCGPVPAPAD